MLRKLGNQGIEQEHVALTYRPIFTIIKFQRLHWELLPLRKANLHCPGRQDHQNNA